MNVLMISPVSPMNIGGIEKHIEGLSIELVKKGNYVSIIVFTKEKLEKIYEYNYKGIKIYEVPFWYFFGVPILPRRKFPVRSLKHFDILHVHDPQVLGITLFVIVLGWRLPKILGTHGGYFHTRKKILIKKLFWFTITKFLLKFYDRVVCVSKSDYQKFKEIVRPNKCAYIPNGVDVSGFSILRNFYSYTKKVLVYYGRLSVNKNIVKLVKIYKMLLSNNKDLVCILIGAISNKEIKNEIEITKALYPKRFFHYGFLSKERLLRKLQGTSHFITASKYEGFGMSVVEMQAAGRIVIANDIEAFRMLIDNGVNGFLIKFEAQDGQIVREIENILALDKKTASRIRETAIRFSERFSWNQISNRYLKLYLDLIEK